MLLKSAKSLSVVHSSKTRSRVTSTPSDFQLLTTVLQQRCLTGTQLARLTGNEAPYFQPSECKLEKRALENVNKAKSHI